MISILFSHRLLHVRQLEQNQERKIKWLVRRLSQFGCHCLHFRYWFLYSQTMGEWYQLPGRLMINYQLQYGTIRDRNAVSPLWGKLLTSLEFRKCRIERNVFLKQFFVFNQKLTSIGKLIISFRCGHKSNFSREVEALRGCSRQVAFFPGWGDFQI